MGVVQPSRRPAHRPRSEAPAEWSVPALAAIPAFVAMYLAAASKYSVSPWIAVAYGALSLVCFLAYALDKSAARTGGWRTSEQSLSLSDQPA